jgi:hypothetical protein
MLARALGPIPTNFAVKRKKEKKFGPTLLDLFSTGKMLACVLCTRLMSPVTFLVNT